MRHGEYKTAGGKLVIADFQIVDYHLSSVSISGDFFLEPPEALQAINQALDRLPASVSESELTEAIEQSLPAGTEMVGFSARAVAIAVRRGLDG